MDEVSAEDRLRQPYARVIVPDDEGLFSAQILEFPGCYSSGESAEEALSNLEVAAVNWIETARDQGLDIPAPLATHEFSGTISLRLPRSYHRKAAELAREEGVSLNQFLVTAIGARVGAEDYHYRLLADMRDAAALAWARTAAYVSVPELQTVPPSAVTPSAPETFLIDANVLVAHAESANAFETSAQILIGEEATSHART